MHLFAPHLDRTRAMKAAQAAGQDEVDALFAGVELPTYS
jgi:hypothetical protein